MESPGKYQNGWAILQTSSFWETLFWVVTEIYPLNVDRSMFDVGGKPHSWAGGRSWVVWTNQLSKPPKQANSFFTLLLGFPHWLLSLMGYSLWARLTPQCPPPTSPKLLLVSQYFIITVEKQTRTCIQYVTCRFVIHNF